MTELQIKAASLEEERRHNRALENITHAQNAATAKHYEVSDTYTAEHYKRSDTAGLISANANAMNADTNRINAATNAKNAETNRLSYEMTHDIEYGWTGESVYPSGMPLSAQQKSAQIQSTIETTQADVALKEAQTENVTVDTPTKIVNAIFGRSGILGGIKQLGN